MILVYRVFTTFLYPCLVLFIYLRKIIKKEDPVRFKEKILVSHFKVKKRKKAKLIWFHSASIGEFKSIIPIINYLNIYHKNLKFLITTTTFSSGNLAKVELKKFNNVEHRYFPLDVPFLVEQFLNLWKPDNIFLVDSEIWPNLILKVKEKKIPIALINARLTSKSFNKWMIFSNIAKKIFGVFSLFICSNAETKAFLKKLNLRNIYFIGNIKLAYQVNEKKVKNLNESILTRKKFWLAASTHKEEHLICLKTHIKLKKRFGDMRTIIAPRHIERFEEIKSLSKKFKLNVQVLNKNEKILKNKEIIIINYFGALTGYFKYVKSVFIGKSMILKLQDQGGQNPIEAAKLGCKIYHGPYVYNFNDIYRILARNKISKKINNYDELSGNLALDFEKSKKKIYENKNLINRLGQKTLNDTMKIVNSFLDGKII
ncbi:hypothetical protein IDH09_04420 [Pelagibacterales bacterium SAG-MED28]|nr:hypothetical protein [Pelagibacterales bacterium SAG-MED28]|tara:strand:+ start:2645 stop:3928 length:1284 start_codon:yes stop_codon:yes gene_type:complete